MSRSFWLLAAGLFVGLTLALNTFVVVPQTHQGLVLQFGRAVRTINVGETGRPGLYVKTPFIEEVRLFRKQNLGVTLEGRDAIVAADQQRLEVDAFARYRIVNPLLFYQTAQNEVQAESRLATLMNGALRRVLGSATSTEIISGQRAALMRAIAADMQGEAKQLGVQIIDVRIRQADLPQAIADRVFERMRTERAKVAAQTRAEGQEQATRIRAEAEKDRTVILATAQEEAAKIKGEGDAERARIFAQAFGRDPEFAAFYRSLQAYETALQAGTPVVITPDSEFFKYLRDKDAR